MLVRREEAAAQHEKLERAQAKLAKLDEHAGAKLAKRERSIARLKSAVAESRERAATQLGANGRDHLVHEITLGRGLAAFRATADRLQESHRTLLGPFRMHVLWQAAANAPPEATAAAELGVYRGGSTFLIAAAFRAFSRKLARLDAIDTFAGHPEAAVDPLLEPRHPPGLFGNVDVEDVRQFLAEVPEAVIRQGAFAEVAPTLPPAEYGLVHIDVDTYRTTRDALDFFYGRLARGGIIVVDDYGAPACPGVRKAVHEFLAATPGCSVWQMRTEQCVIVK